MFRPGSEELPRLAAFPKFHLGANHQSARLGVAFAQCAPISSVSVGANDIDLNTVKMLSVYLEMNGRARRLLQVKKAHCTCG